MSEYNFSLSRIFSYKDRIEEFSRISRSKGNRTMKLGLGQLIKCNMRNIFREKHSQNVMEKLFPDPLLKNQK